MSIVLDHVGLVPIHIYGLLVQLLQRGHDIVADGSELGIDIIMTLTTITTTHHSININCIGQRNILLGQRVEIGLPAIPSYAILLWWWLTTITIIDNNNGGIGGGSGVRFAPVNDALTKW
jgi:hypothetical protein